VRRPSLVIRPEERRETHAAFLTLFGFVASHAMLETARDALFLAKVPATHLPWVFIAIAGMSLTLANVQHRFSSRLGGRTALAVWIGVAGSVTLGFWLLLPILGSAGVYTLYVWSGVLTTLVLVHFWTLLGTIFSITQAKRLYGVIGAGSVIGALAGSGMASALSLMIEARHLVLGSAIGFLLTALLPLRFAKQAAATPIESGEVATGFVGHARFIARHPYARNVVILMISATACVTVADYLFKSTVAQKVAPEELGAYFGTISFVLNFVSLGVQVGIVGFAVRRLGVSGALAVLPLLLLAFGVGMAVTGSLVAALAIKSADGSFRYSLHRTASELLFLPLAEDARRHTKSFTDVVAHRGGQALTSIIIIVLAAIAAPGYILAGVLVALAAMWLSAALSLRAPYLDLFRSRLQGRRAKGDLGFDVGSLETLVRALDSENDGDVIAALDVLAAEGKARLVPVLILYHPSDAIVERALEIFTKAQRKNVVPIIDRLAEHSSPRVRAATLAARSVLDPDVRPLRMRLSFEESPEVRAAIVVNLIASGEIVGSDAAERIEALMRHGTVATKTALAEAIGRRAASGFDDVLEKLARKGQDLKLRVAAVRAIGRVKPTSCLPMLIEMLGEELIRPDAQEVLVEYGVNGFKALVAAIEDPTLISACRVRLPQTIAKFDPELASAILLEWLTRERDGTVRYQIGRALERLLHRVPSLVLDPTLLDRTIAATVSRAYRYLDRRIILTRGAAEDRTRETPGHTVLVQLLSDKEENAIERLFGLIGLAYKSDDFTDIYRGLTSKRKGARATSVELIENILREPLRTAVLGLVDDIPDRDRLAAAGTYHTPIGLGYEGLLAEMLESTSESLQDLTIFHIGELRLRSFQAAIAELPNAATRTDVVRTLEILREREAG
jgi:ATP:ADP antiporter, AAA family